MIDADAALRFIREHCATLLDRDCTHAEVVDSAVDLAQQFRDLDESLSQGGALPRDWRSHRHQPLSTPQP